MQTHSSDYPPEVQTTLVVPGELRLESIRWIPAGARAIGTVGGVRFDIAVTVADMLDRKRFAFNLWRFKHLLPILPDFENWQSAIAAAEARGK